MQTIQIQVNDSYLEKFLNLLQALPQDEIKVVDRECEENRKRFQKVLMITRVAELSLCLMKMAWMR